MTISSATCTVTAIGDGATTDFNYGFIIPFQADGVTPAVYAFITVADVKTPLVLDTDYSITGVGNSAGGTVHYPISGSPLANPDTITIDRDLAYTQPFAVANQSFYPNTVEQVADWLDMQIQQVARDISRLGS